MTDHDAALLDRLRRDPSSHVVDADDPTAVAAALVGDGARPLPPDEVAGWVAEARLLRARAEAVLAAEQVVAGAAAFERARWVALVSGAPDAGGDPGPDAHPDGDDGDRHDDGPDADRNAVRFSLTVLAVAQVGGLAVAAADDLLLAALLPAVAIVGVIGVALAHRTPRRPPASGAASEPATARDAADERTRSEPAEETVGVPASPAVRAAEAHLRRQLAAWKVAWWERGLPPADVGTWLGGSPATPPATLVVVDDGRVDADLHAAMTDALPSAVRVVLLRPAPRAD